ncbi:hypothetical protein EJ377_01795 [Chryseobacterium arthrosphaerae]|uniref:Uncharacterized protein n=1 Tax=Chryseobacterium arthrosphaerae TaxID=651561 RepID=A0A432DYP6_9FLAO|nr:hypothetical protein EJ377_01795 [Chryseobacterium arthrosphaerae]
MIYAGYWSHEYTDENIVTEHYNLGDFLTLIIGQTLQDTIDVLNVGCIMTIRGTFDDRLVECRIKM